MKTETKALTPREISKLIEQEMPQPAEFGSETAQDLWNEKRGLRVQELYAANDIPFQLCKCDDCGWRGDVYEINESEDHSLPDDICPAGSCPECGSSAFIEPSRWVARPALVIAEDALATVRGCIEEALAMAENLRDGTGDAMPQSICFTLRAALARLSPPEQTNYPTEAKAREAASLVSVEQEPKEVA